MSSRASSKARWTGWSAAIRACLAVRGQGPLAGSCCSRSAWPAAGGYIFTQLKSELSPTEDRGTIIVSGNAPEGASFAYTKRYAEQVEEILAQVPELQSYLMIVGMGRGHPFNSFGRLKDWSERDVEPAAASCRTSCRNCARWPASRLPPPIRHRSACAAAASRSNSSSSPRPPTRN